MLNVSIPGFADLRLEHLVCDYNGTLALDGLLIEGVRARLDALAHDVRIHVVTADTFGRCAAELADVDCGVIILPPGAQDAAKAEHVRNLGAGRTVAIGNGRNDSAMLETAVLGIAVLGPEGTAAVSITAARMVAPGILVALDLLLNPLRLVASLRC